MPTYVYECQDCNVELEVQQKITEDALTVYPHSDNEGNDCNGELKKLIAGGVNFQLSGTGWTPNFHG